MRSKLRTCYKVPRTHIPSSAVFLHTITRQSTHVTLSRPHKLKLSGLGTFVIIILDLHMVLGMCHSKCYNSDAITRWSIIMPLRASAGTQTDGPEYLLSCPPVHLLQTDLGMGTKYFHVDRHLRSTEI